MSGSAVTVEKAAYLKLMLHAAKYPWASVSGFLLGETGSSEEEQVTVKDAVPLFHTATLAPLLETSAAMVDAHAAKIGLSIVGFYQANQCLDENSPSLLATKIMDKIDLANGGSSVLLVVSNKRLETRGDSAVSVFARDASNSFRKRLEVGVSSQCIEAFESALTKRAETGLVDMDEHFDDVTKDWRNPGIVSA
eukprot:jgi/Undpi1/4425/HiC_scaffold_17.g07780.m1